MGGRMIDNKLDREYQELLRDILANGTEKDDRTGTGTISVFGRQIRHNMRDGFPLLTTKKMAIKSIMTELKWFLKGDTNIKYLVDNGCNIWNGDAYKAYEKYAMANSYGVDILSMEEFIQEIKTNDEFASKWGNLGPIYGKQWRRWKTDSVSIDQIQDLISELKTNPDSRRLMVNAWNVGEMHNMVLPPCHYGFQCYTKEMTFGERALYWTSSIGKDISYASKLDESDLDEKNVPNRKLSLMWNQRSVDTFLGLPFNIASYGLLLEIIAKEVNMVPDELIGNLGDVHLYKNHIEQAKEQIDREPMELPKILINNGEVDNNGVPFTKSMLDGYDRTDFELVDYKSHPTIKAPLSN